MPIRKVSRGVRRGLSRAAHLSSEKAQSGAAGGGISVMRTGQTIGKTPTASNQPPAFPALDNAILGRPTEARRPKGTDPTYKPKKTEKKSLPEKDQQLPASPIKPSPHKQGQMHRDNRDKICQSATATEPKGTTNRARGRGRKESKSDNSNGGERTSQHPKG